MLNAHRPNTALQLGNKLVEEARTDPKSTTPASQPDTPTAACGPAGENRFAALLQNQGCLSRNCKALTHKANLISWEDGRILHL